MENSMNSMSKLTSSNERMSDGSPDLDHEESGWTAYFDDFFNQYNIENSGTESSLISDAASSVAKKAADHDDQVMGFSLDKRCNRLSFKKRKTKAVDLVDNDLEDTASSPVNSPKIYNLINQQLDRKPEEKDIMDISQVKGTSTSAQIDERIGLPGSTDNKESELKKRGLCLVPLSMLANYLG